MLVLVKCFDIKMVKSPGGLHAANQQKKRVDQKLQNKKELSDELGEAKAV